LGKFGFTSAVLSLNRRADKEKWGRQASDPAPYYNVEAPVDEESSFVDRQAEQEAEEANVDDEEIKLHWKKDDRHMSVTEERERKQK
jgi:hypothetical protein